MENLYEKKSPLNKKPQNLFLMIGFVPGLSPWEFCKYREIGNLLSNVFHFHFVLSSKLVALRENKKPPFRTVFSFIEVPSGFEPE